MNVKFEGITDYEGEMKTRMSTTNYGDVIGIPHDPARPVRAVLRAARRDRRLRGQVPVPHDGTAFDGTQYGIAIGGNANGVVYNKKVFEEAGVTELPDDAEDDWLDALQEIKDNTDAIPLYTNYKDGWPLTQWFGNLGAVTDDPDAPIDDGARRRAVDRGHRHLRHRLAALRRRSPRA